MRTAKFCNPTFLGSISSAQMFIDHASGSSSVSRAWSSCLISLGESQCAGPAFNISAFSPQMIFIPPINCSFLAPGGTCNHYAPLAKGLLAQLHFHPLILATSMGSSVAGINEFQDVSILFLGNYHWKNTPSRVVLCKAYYKGTWPLGYLFKTSFVYLFLDSWQLGILV